MKTGLKDKKTRFNMKNTKNSFYIEMTEQKARGVKDPSYMDRNTKRRSADQMVMTSRAIRGLGIIKNDLLNKSVCTKMRILIQKWGLGKARTEY